MVLMRRDPLTELDLFHRQMDQLIEDMGGSHNLDSVY